MAVLTPLSSAEVSARIKTGKARLLAVMPWNRAMRAA